MARTVLEDVDRVLASAWYKAWALVHPTDAKKIRLERSGQRRPVSGDSWARTFIEAIRVGLWVQPPPPPPPPPPPGPVAPRSYNAAPGGEPSARFCTAGLPRNANGRLADIYSEYDDDGRDLGGRTALHVEGLPPADAMDHYGPCDTREWMGRVFPPYPPESYER